MSPLDSIPLFLAIPVAFFVFLGATLTLIGALGFARLNSFYDRLHAPTLATSWGAGGILLGSVMMFSTLGSRLVVPELFLGLMMLVTTPVTLMVLGRAALHRDRAEGTLPPAPGDDHPETRE